MNEATIISNDIMITAKFASEAEKTGYFHGWSAAFVTLDEVITNITEANPYVDGKINIDVLKLTFAEVYKSVMDALDVKD